MECNTSQEVFHVRSFNIVFVQNIIIRQELRYMFLFLNSVFNSIVIIQRTSTDLGIRGVLTRLTPTPKLVLNILQELDNSNISLKFQFRIIYLDSDKDNTSLNKPW